MKIVKTLLPLAALALCGFANAGTRDHSVVVKYGDLNLNSQAGIARLHKRISNAAESVCDTLSKSPAIAKDCPSRSSATVSARRVVSAGIRNPDSVIPFTKSRVLTSGRTFSRITSPAMVGVKFKRIPNSLKMTETAPVVPCAIGTGNSPPARKLASWLL